MLPNSRFVRLIAVIAVSGFLLAADSGKPPEEPRSPKAKSAIEKHRMASEKLRAEYYAKRIAEDEQFVKELDASLKAVAASSGDAAEIERIASARKSAKDELQQYRDGLNGPKYWLWSFDKFGKHWLRSDGTCVSANGPHGRWERHGNRITLRWDSGSIDILTISDDGISFVAVNNRNDHFNGTLEGTDLTGAEAPPN